MNLTSAIAALLLTSLSSMSFASDLPDMLGTWKPTGETAAARIGAAVAGYPESSKPLFNLQPRPYAVFEAQEGRQVAGYEIFPDGKKEPFVGVFRRNGELMISTIRGTATVDYSPDGNMEWCWQDHLGDVAVVSCDVMRKETGKP